MTSNPVFGNYHGYYAKRPALHDPRLALLPPTFFADKTVLDVGCNDGLVTCEIAHAWDARRVIGVDIDETLVRAAWKRRRTLWSTQAPPPSSTTTTTTAADYFPTSCEHTHGPLPIPPTPTDGFPHNVAFRTADWVTAPTESDDTVYDVVLAFSITKWVHLNHGDDGLRALFRRAHAVLRPGGALLVEPQAWETYGKARRMDARLRDNATRLVLRPHDFPALLAAIGFGPPQHLGASGEGGFHRPVDLYVKQ